MINPRGLVSRARRAAESLMLDSCEIAEVTGTTTNSDGSVTPTYGTPVYSGKCKIQKVRGGFPKEPIASGHMWTIDHTELQIPVNGTVGVQVGQRLIITASFDPNNVGRVYRIRTNDRKTLQSCVRLQVVELVG